MEAAVIDHYGGPEVLHLSDVADPTPGQGEALLRVAAASINPVDARDRAGEIGGAGHAPSPAGRRRPLAAIKHRTIRAMGRRRLPALTDEIILRAKP
jgi:hypothetical protein